MRKERGIAQDDYWALAGDRTLQIRRRIAKIDSGTQSASRVIVLLMIGQPLRQLFTFNQSHDHEPALCGPCGFCIAAPSSGKIDGIFRHGSLTTINRRTVVDFNKNTELLMPEISGSNDIAQPWGDITKAWSGIIDHIDNIQIKYATIDKVTGAGPAISAIDNAARATAMRIVVGDLRIAGAMFALADLAILSAARLVSDAGEMLYLALNGDFQDSADNAEFKRLLSTIMETTGDGANELPVAGRIIIATIRAARAMALALDLYCVTRNTGHRTVVSSRANSGHNSDRTTVLDVVNFQSQWAARPTDQESADKLIYGKHCCPASDPNDDLLAAAFKTRLFKDAMDPKIDVERLLKICEAFGETAHFDLISTIMGEIAILRDSHLTSRPSQFTAITLAAIEREITKTIKRGGEFNTDNMLTAFDSHDDAMRMAYPILKGRDIGVFRSAIAITNATKIEVSNLYAPSIRHLHPIAETRCSEATMARYAADVLSEKTWLGVNVGKSYIGKLLLGRDAAGVITPLALPSPKRISTWRRSVLEEWLSSAAAFVSGAIESPDGGAAAVGGVIFDIALQEEIAALFGATDERRVSTPINNMLDLHNEFDTIGGGGLPNNSYIAETRLKTAMPSTIAFDLLSKTATEKKLDAAVMGAASALIHAGILDMIFQITDLACKPTLGETGCEQVRYILYAARQIILSINLINSKPGRSLDDLRIDGIAALGVVKWLKFMANQKNCAALLAKTPAIAKQKTDQAPLLFNGPRVETYENAWEVAMGLAHQDDLIGLRILPMKLFDLGVGIDFFNFVVGEANKGDGIPDRSYADPFLETVGTGSDLPNNPSRDGKEKIDMPEIEDPRNLTTMAVDARRKWKIADRLPPPTPALKIFLDRIDIGRNTDFPMSGTALKMSAESSTPLHSISHDKVNAAMEMMAAEFPWMESEIRFIFERVHFNGIKLPPILLVGLPGTGKSMFARRLAELLGLPNIIYAVSTSADNSFAGTPRQWSTSRMSVPLQQVVKSGMANPMIILDEIEKGATSNRNGSLLSAILPFLDKSTASKMFDPACEASVDLSAVNYIATANQIGGLEPALLSRFTVVRFKSPTLRDIPRLVACIAYSKREAIPEAAYGLADEEIRAIAKAWRGGTLRRLDKMVEATLMARRMTCMMN